MNRFSKALESSDDISDFKRGIPYLLVVIVVIGAMLIGAYVTDGPRGPADTPFINQSK